MTTTIDHSVRQPRRSRKAGFTLVETLVAMFLGLLIGGVIFSALIFVGKSTLGIANYSNMNVEGRLGLETLGRDVRSAADILSGFDETSFTILIPDPDDPTVFDQVTYNYLPDLDNRPLVRTEGSDETVVMSNVEELEFNYFDLQANEAEYPIRVKQIQLRLKMVRYAIAIENTEQVVSARYILRNKRVSN